MFSFPRRGALTSKTKRSRQDLPSRRSHLLPGWHAAGWVAFLTGSSGVSLVQYQFSMPGLSQAIDLVSVPDQDFDSRAENRLRIEAVRSLRSSFSQRFGALRCPIGLTLLHDLHNSCVYAGVRLKLLGAPNLDLKKNTSTVQPPQSPPPHCVAARVDIGES
jgi:hypothetical protein